MLEIPTILSVSTISITPCPLPPVSLPLAPTTPAEAQEDPMDLTACPCTSRQPVGFDCYAERELAASVLKPLERKRVFEKSYAMYMQGTCHAIAVSTCT